VADDQRELDATRAVAHRNAEIARHNDAVVVRYLARVQDVGLSSRVQHALIESLPNGEPSKQAIARALAMSPRNLQRRLAERCEFLRIEKTGRGRFRLNVARPIKLVEMPA